MKSLFRNITRVLALVLAAVLLLPLLPNAVLSASADSSGTDPLATAESEAVGSSNSQSMTYTGASVPADFDVSVTYSGNRTYLVDVDLSFDITKMYEPVSVSTAQKGIQPITQTGYYLIELWGGNGADGQTILYNPLPFIFYYHHGGDGGDGGYVYGIVYLYAGQYVIYDVGTNGSRSIRNDDEAGGKNGDGGTHGSAGAYFVGGGGGYSAVYIIEDSEYASCVDSSGNVQIPEKIRQSRYAFIAGGGGGGGAGDGLVFAQEGTSDGGTGGSISSSTAISLSGNYNVPGTVYAGADGSFTGSSSEYRGVGGSVYPGADPASVWDFSTATSAANDWAGIANTSIAPGAGGSGNFRGGGGGGGFAGGSGGIMKSFLLPENVGGGGGGSSFIASTVNAKQVITDLSGTSLGQKASQYMLGEDHNPGANGGAFVMTFLSSDSTQLDLSVFDNISFTLEFGSNFVVNSAFDGTNEISMTKSGNSVTVSGIHTVPYSSISASQPAHVQFQVTAIESFWGGNQVEFLRGCSASFKDPVSTSTVRTVSTGVSANVRYVNVLIDRKIASRDLMTSVDKRYLSSDLFTLPDNIVFGSSVSDYAGLSGISAITDDILTNLNTGANVTGSIDIVVTPENIGTSIKYRRSFTITVKNPGSSSIVGPVIPSKVTISAVGSIFIVDEDTASLNGVVVNGQKTLEYNNGVYSFLLRTSSESAKVTFSKATTPIWNSQTFTAETSGWYFIQAWGGSGGKAGDATAINLYLAQKEGKFNSLISELSAEDQETVRKDYSETTMSKDGGRGGYTGGYYYLNAGETLTIHIGSGGTQGSQVGAVPEVYSKTTYAPIYSTGGTGGSYTSIQAGSTYLMIAGGGGGTGGVASCQKTVEYRSSVAWTGMFETIHYSNGNVANENYQTTYESTLSTDMSVYNGTSGGTGSASYTNSEVKYSGGTAGTRGASYLDSSLINPSGLSSSSYYATHKEYYNLVDVAKTTDGAGFAKITLLESSDVIAEQEKLSGVSFSGVFSKYFDVSDSISFKLTDSLEEYTTSIETLGTRSYRYTYSAKDRTFAAFTLSFSTAADGVSTRFDITDLMLTPDRTVTSIPSSVSQLTYQFSTEYLIAFSLTPKEGFLGGNDVPVLVPNQIAPGVQDASNHTDQGIRISQTTGGNSDFLFLTEKNHSDYVNVPIEKQIDSYLDAVDSYDLVKGQSVTVSSLYTFDSSWFPTGADSWKADFVHLEYCSDGVLSPTVNTVQTVGVYLRPNAAPVKAALVSAGAGESVASADVNIRVVYLLTANLTHTTLTDFSGHTYASPIAFIADSSQNTIKIKPEFGYLTPITASVTKDGVALTEGTDYTFDSSTGEMVFTLAAMEGNLVISAEATRARYRIHYIYQRANLDGTFRTETHDSDLYYSEDDLSSEGFIASLASELDSDIALLNSLGTKQYEYNWEWEPVIVDNQMPANDVYVTGSFSPVKVGYTFTCVDASGVSLGSEYEFSELYFSGDSYEFITPVIDRMRPYQITVNGTPLAVTDFSSVIGTVDTVPVDRSVPIDVKIYYESSDGYLTVYYRYENGKTAASEYSEQVGPGEQRTITVNEITGYTAMVPETPYVVTMPSDGSGLTVIVVYRPNHYTVSFVYRYDNDPESSYDAYGDTSLANLNTAAASMNSDIRLVEFGKTMGYSCVYDSATDTYTGSYCGLPTPYVSGCRFVGWYANADFSGEKLSEDTVIDGTGATTYYAKWEPVQVTVIVFYDVSYDWGDYEPTAEDYANLPELVNGVRSLQATLTAGEDYSFILPYIQGYYPYRDYANQASRTKLTGTSFSGPAPGTDQMIYITYRIRSYTVYVSGAKVTYYNYDGTPDTSTLTKPEISYDSYTSSTIKYSKTYTLTTAFTQRTARVQTLSPFSSHYELSPTGWEFEDGTHYDSSDGITFVADKEDGDEYYIYSTYDAVEYIVELVVGSSTKKRAATTAGLETAIYDNTYKAGADKVVLRFIRNPGNPSELHLSETVNIKVHTYNSTDGITIDLNGIDLTINSATGFDFSQGSYQGTIYLKDSNATGTNTGHLTVSDSSASYVYGLYCAKSKLCVESVAIEVNAGTGTAVGIAGGSDSEYVYLRASNGGISSLSVTSQNGNAYGLSWSNEEIHLYGPSTDAFCPITVSAPNGTAFGLYSSYPSSLCYVYYCSFTVTGQSATGIKFLDTSARTYNVFCVSLNVTGTNYACGLNGNGKFSEPTTNAQSPLSINVNSPDGSAYGVDAYSFQIGADASSTRIYTITVSGATEAVGIRANQFGLAKGTHNQYFCVNVSTVNGTAKGLVVYGSNSSPCTGSTFTINVTGTGTGIMYELESTGTLTDDRGYFPAVTFNLSDSASVIYMVNCGTYSGKRFLITWNVTAVNGNAIVIVNSGTLSTTFTVTATTTGTGNATGIVNSGTLNVSGITVTATATGTGNATGTRMEGGTLSESIPLSTTVTAASGNAYGLFLAGGSIPAKSITTYRTVSAISSSGSGYGIYATAGTFGAGGDDISTYIGTECIAVAGSTWAVYAEQTDTVFLRGHNFFMKGADASHVISPNVNVFTGYSLYAVTHNATYAGYYLLAKTYTLVFVNIDQAGTDNTSEYSQYTFKKGSSTLTGHVYSVTLLPYAYDGSISVTAPGLAGKTGWSSAWDSYDWSLPDNDDYKFVFSTYTVNQYTITIMKHNGDSPEYETITLDYDTLLSSSADAVTKMTASHYSKKGYSFTRFYQSDSSVAYSFPERMPAYNQTVHIYWTVNQYWVIINASGGKFLNGEGEEVEELSFLLDYGSHLPAVANPTKYGHKFDHYTNGKGTSAVTVALSDVLVTDSTTYIYAVYIANPHTFTVIKNNGDTQATESVTIPYDSLLSNYPATKSSHYSKEGYSFTRFYLTDSSVEYTLPTRMPDEDITVQIYWTINQYRIVIRYGVEGYSDYVIGPYDYGTPLTAPDITQFQINGGLASGFQSAQRETISFPATMPASNRSDRTTYLYIKWDYNQYWYRLNGEQTIQVRLYYNYDKDGDGTVNDEGDIYKTYTLSTSNPTLPADSAGPENGSQAFRGWFTSASDRSADTYAFGLYQYGTSVFYDFVAMDIREAALSVTARDYIVSFYAGWWDPSTLTSTAANVVPLGTSSTSSATLTVTDPKYTKETTQPAATYSYYMYYVVPSTGSNYSLCFNIGTASQNKNYQIYSIALDGTQTPHETGACSSTSVSTSLSGIELTAGSIVVIKWGNATQQKSETNCGDTTYYYASYAACDVSAYMNIEEAKKNGTTAKFDRTYSFWPSFPANLPTVSGDFDPLSLSREYAGWATQDSEGNRNSGVVTRLNDAAIATLNWQPGFENAIDLYPVYYSVITFNSQGGSDVAEIKAVSGTSIGPPGDPTLTDQYFGGWFTDEECTSGYTFDTMPEGVLTLFAKWKDYASAKWYVKTANGRLFSTFDGASTVTIRDNATVSVLYYTAELLTVTDASLSFSQTLEAGTLFTLIDFSDPDDPVYYTYTVTAAGGITELELTSFRRMGVADSPENHFVGASSTMMLTVCFTNAKAAANTVITFANDVDDCTSATATVSVISSEPIETEATEDVVISRGTASVPIPVPDLLAQGFSSSDLVWISVSVAQGGLPEQVSATVADGEAGFLRNGVLMIPVGTVASVTGTEVTVELSFGAARFFGIENLVFTVSVASADFQPEYGSVFGNQLQSALVYLQSIGWEANSVTVSQKTAEVKLGQRLTLTGISCKNPKDLKILVQQNQVVTGTTASDVHVEMMTTANCFSLFSAENGYAVDRETGELLHNGKSVALEVNENGGLVLPVSGDALPGIYCLVFQTEFRDAVVWVTVQ